MDIERLQAQLEQFASERGWERYHTPKNLSMALAGEAAELMEVFQWMTPEESVAVAESPEDLQRAEEEIADVFIYLARLTATLGIDLESAVQAKIAMNAAKYPVPRSDPDAHLR